MKKFSPKTINRSLLYLRILDKLVSQDQEYVSSRELAQIVGLTDVQIRKDISNFGKVGKPRIGYKVLDLKKKIEHFILQNVVHVVLFGVGKLGSAILKYPAFHQDKIKIVAAFDSDKEKIGSKIQGVMIFSLNDASKVIKKSHAEMAIIAVPANASQDTADLIVSCGLKGIVNFSPATIGVPQGVYVKYIDLSIEFLSLFHKIPK